MIKLDKVNLAIFGFDGALAREYTTYKNKLTEYETWHNNFRIAIIIILSIVKFVEFL